ncbi:MAG: MarR family winged helix-turn-helix transcriptional regulator [Asticcacaulis sp.]
MRDLRLRLGLDSGYMSRLLRTLEQQGLLRLAASAHDRRARRITLTDKGLAEVTAYDALSDGLARSLVEPLDTRQRDKLVAAMAEVERLLRASAVVIGEEPADSRDAQACIRLYLEELSRRFDTGYDPNTAAPAGAEQFLPPVGAFVIARLDGRAIGCGGLETTGDYDGRNQAPVDRPGGAGHGCWPAHPATAGGYRPFMGHGAGYGSIPTGRYMKRKRSIWRRVIARCHASTTTLTRSKFFAKRL